MSFFGSSAVSQPMFGTANNAMFSTNNSMNALLPQSQSLPHNPMKDWEVVSPPDDSISSLAFSPPTLQQNYLIAGSWDNQIRCWEITGNQNSWQTIPKAQQTHTGPVLDVAWSEV
jgi:mRNA export factor